MYRYFAAQTNVAARVPLVLAIGTRALIKLGAALAGVKLYDDAHVSAGTG
jgi:hypothetical protein